MPVLRTLARSPWFSYITILLLQLKLVWGMWWYRDLTPGDTSDYFVQAWAWFSKGHALITWSPGYTAYYALFLPFFKDVYAATIAHRLVVVLLRSVLVLALMRRLLP